MFSNGTPHALYLAHKSEHGEILQPYSWFGDETISRIMAIANYIIDTRVLPIEVVHPCRRV